MLPPGDKTLKVKENELNSQEEEKVSRNKKNNILDDEKQMDEW